MSAATNLRQLRGLAILPGHHLWVVGADGAEWAGPRVSSTYFVPQSETAGSDSDQIECRTVNGGVFYVLPHDVLTVCDHTSLLGDLA